jgi:hypothetical protein
MGDGLWEARTTLPSNRIARVLFFVSRDRIVLLHDFFKKTQKTPDEELALARKRQRDLKIKEPRMMTKAKKKKAPRSSAEFSTLDDFLREKGKLEEFQAIAIKEVLAWQMAQAMKANKISRSGLATKMKTSRSQIGRLLDPKDGNVTLATLQRAARMMGRKLRLDLV